MINLRSQTTALDDFTIAKHLPEFEGYGTDGVKFVIGPNGDIYEAKKTKATIAKSITAASWQKLDLKPTGKIEHVPNTNRDIGKKDEVGTYLLDANTANATATLPKASETEGEVYTIKATKVTAPRTASVVPAAGETIDDLAVPFVLVDQYDSITVQSDGTGWKIISRISKVDYKPEPLNYFSLALSAGVVKFNGSDHRLDLNNSTWTTFNPNGWVLSNHSLAVKEGGMYTVSFGGQEGANELSWQFKVNGVVKAYSQAVEGQGYHSKSNVVTLELAQDDVLTWHDTYSNSHGNCYGMYINIVQLPSHSFSKILEGDMMVNKAGLVDGSLLKYDEPNDRMIKQGTESIWVTQVLGTWAGTKTFSDNSTYWMAVDGADKADKIEFTFQLNGDAQFTEAISFFGGNKRELLCSPYDVWHVRVTVLARYASGFSYKISDANCDARVIRVDTTRNKVITILT